MATIDFKSVGTTIKQKIEHDVQKTAIPIGIKTPLQLSTTDDLFLMNYSLKDQVRDNFRNLILTNWGERLGQFTFGANLRQLLFEFTSLDNFDNEAVVRIKNAVTKWMPYINLEDYVSSIDRQFNDGNTANIKLIITYSVPTLNASNQMIEVTLKVV